MAIWYRWCITLYNSAAHVLCTFVYIYELAQLIAETSEEQIGIWVVFLLT